jgi:hypothetical protein
MVAELVDQGNYLSVLCLISFKTLMVEAHDADGMQWNYETTGTSERGRLLECVNPDSSASIPAETMVSPST